MSTVVVTGGAGYVGSHAVKALAAAGRDVVVYDDLSAGHAEAVARVARAFPGRRISLARGDILDRAALEAVLRSSGAAAVLHFAARLLGRRVDARPDRLLSRERRRHADPARGDGGRRRAAPRVLVHRRDVRRTARDPHRRGSPAASGQPVRGNQAGGRARAAACRARDGDPVRHVPVLQRRRRRPGRPPRRGPRSRGAPDPARDRGRARRGAADGVRRRLRHAGRHLRARLRARLRPGGRARRRAGRPRIGRRLGRLQPRQRAGHVGARGHRGRRPRGGPDRAASDRAAAGRRSGAAGRGRTRGRGAISAGRRGCGALDAIVDTAWRWHDRHPRGYKDAG